MGLFGSLINAVNTTVNTATNPNAQQEAANMLAAALTDAARRGENVAALLMNGAAELGRGALGAAGGIFGAVGSVQLTAIGNVQRFLADVASGTVVPTPGDVQAIIAQLLAGLGSAGQGAGFPGGAGFPTLPGLPFPIPAFPGLDPCKFLKCLAASIDCSCGSSGSSAGGGHVPQPDSDKGDDPVAVLIGNGVEILDRARGIAENRLRDMERRAADLFAAEKAAEAAVKNEIQKARKQAEKDVETLRTQRDQLTTTIGSAIAQSWPPKR